MPWGRFRVKPERFAGNLDGAVAAWLLLYIRGNATKPAA